jgi:hypothetical protein
MTAGRWVLKPLSKGGVSMKLYMTILAFSLLLGLAVFAVMPEQAMALKCGDPPCQAYWCCDGQGDCDPGYMRYGTCLTAPPSCQSVCHFNFIGCWFEEFC